MAPPRLLAWQPAVTGDLGRAGGALGGLATIIPEPEPPPSSVRSGSRARNCRISPG